ncbi:5'-deoxyadenosine deaminase [Haladaptatus caseinilyticus]|uniref:5'-deoxyadenosine deaminase n=1 Tax=Haladaptatus caseinilyticus TaxID=2993314 RepID=UPI00224AECA3|nr:5'-deoxyadenosine deaminase [Haladaptatus caseinilyticus]
MILTGTVVADATTIIEDGAVVVRADTIEAVGERVELLDRYPAHEVDEYDLLLPGLVGGHVHSVQSLGRGIADDAELLDWLFEYVLPMEANLGPEEMYAAARLGYLELIESGTTTCIDHLSVRYADRAFDAAVEMGIRGRLGKVLMDQRAPYGLHEGTDAGLAATERLIRQYHGANDGRVQYAVTPRFAVSCTEECLRGARRLTDEYDGVRIHTHASENRDEISTVETETGHRNIHWLDEVGLTGDDVVLAHCVWTDESEREVLAETGTHVTYCPSSNMKLASGIAPVIDYLDRGVNVALGNDGPPCNNTLDPFTEMRHASLLQRVNELDAQAAPTGTIFEMATINGARAAGFDRVGKLKGGWKADIIGLTTDVTRATPLYDPLSHAVFGAHGDDVEFTMVAGEVLQQNGEVLAADADAIRAEANEIAAGLDVAPEAGVF